MNIIYFDYIHLQLPSLLTLPLSNEFYFHVFVCVCWQEYMHMIMVICIWYGEPMSL